MNKILPDLDQDNQLIESFIKGETGAFEPLVKKYWGQVYYLCLRYLKNSESASDITQETFITAFSKIDTFIVGRSFRPWLLKIAANKSLKLLNQNRSRPTSELIPDQPGNPDQDPENVLAAKQLLEDCLDKLEFEDQILFLLRHGLHLAYDEMAMILDKPIGSIKGELFRARKKLKDSLEIPPGKEAEADA